MDGQVFGVLTRRRCTVADFFASVLTECVANANAKLKDVQKVMMPVRLLLLPGVLLRCVKRSDLHEKESSVSKFFGSSKRHGNEWRVTHALDLSLCELRNVSEGTGVRRFIMCVDSKEPPLYNYAYVSLLLESSCSLHNAGALTNVCAPK